MEEIEIEENKERKKRRFPPRVGHGTPFTEEDVSSNEK